MRRWCRSLLIALTLWGIWWYVVIHQQAAAEAAVAPGVQQLGSPDLSAKGPATPAELGPARSSISGSGLCAAAGAAVLVRYYWRMDSRTLRSR